MTSTVGNAGDNFTPITAQKVTIRLSPAESSDSGVGSSQSPTHVVELFLKSVRNGEHFAPPSHEEANAYYTALGPDLYKPEHIDDLCILAYYFPTLADKEMSLFQRLATSHYNPNAKKEGGHLKGQLYSIFRSLLNYINEDAGSSIKTQLLVDRKKNFTKEEQQALHQKGPPRYAPLDKVVSKIAAAKIFRE